MKIDLVIDDLTTEQVTFLSVAAMNGDLLIISGVKVSRDLSVHPKLGESGDIYYNPKPYKISLELKKAVDED